MPAIALLTAPAEPRENKTPRKTETPRKASDWDPGMYGNMAMAANAMTRKRMILNVGSAQSRWKPAKVIAPRWIPLNTI
ncbi:MAG: hypothetical protein NBKEAIPA_03140 [Nitrospirae bacterium]|nr:hypothetical protein [Nitrospirota bacterium]